MTVKSKSSLPKSIFLDTNIYIPREDAGVYLTAKQGKAKCFVSRNYKLIRALVEQTEEFECFTPSEFLQKYAP